MRGFYGTHPWSPICYNFAWVPQIFWGLAPHFARCIQCARVRSYIRRIKLQKYFNLTEESTSRLIIHQSSFYGIPILSKRKGCERQASTAKTTRLRWCNVFNYVHKWTEDHFVLGLTYVNRLISHKDMREKCPRLHFPSSDLNLWHFDLRCLAVYTVSQKTVPLLFLL